MTIKFKYPALDATNALPSESKVYWRKKEEEQNGRITHEARLRELVRESSFVRFCNFAFPATQQEREREKIKRAMFSSVSFIDDEVTSQQVLQYWKCSTRELCAHRTSILPAASHLRQIYFRKDYV